MEASVIFEKLLSSYERYYTINRDTPLSPFNATAEFRSHGEQYMLVKAAKIADIDSNEFVYFKVMDSDQTLSAETLQSYIQTAWDDGLSKIEPYYGHRNSDVTVVILADNIDKSLAKIIKKKKLSKTYRYGMYGWSNFRLCAMELSSGQIYANRLGSDVGKILAKIKA